MGAHRTSLAVCLALAVAAVLGLTASRGLHAVASPAPPPGARYRLQDLTAALRARTFTFAGVAAADRQAFLDAVASASAPARRLIGLVDGLVTVRVGPTGGRSVGLTEQTPDGHYDVTLDFATVWPQMGQRGIGRLVLHELGHVVDFALLPDSLTRRLDAEIPAGYGCDDGVLGGCAKPVERFAETFAKWATGDLGFDLYIGYKVPPPSVPLETWGAPLAAFGR